MNKSISYKFAKVYNFLMPIADKGIAEKKFIRISEFIGDDKKVFELGCGTARLRDYLGKGCSYIGWDLNKNFIKDCKNRGVNVEEKNVFDSENYPENDVIVISDILHHIIPRDKELIRKSLKKTKKLIIAEPRAGVKLSIRRTPFWIYKVFDSLFGDSDGINSLENRKKWGFYNEYEVKQYLKEFRPQKIIFLGKNKEKFIAVI